MGDTSQQIDEDLNAKRFVHQPEFIELDATESAFIQNSIAQRQRHTVKWSSYRFFDFRVRKRWFLYLTSL